ncbi:MAG: citrate transporter [Methanoculleus sp. SDB]|nr:MAG: citrate transporter [Methanoculleus sp. SDB]
MDLQIALMLFILGVTVVLFVTEALRVDVIALLVMISLAWLGLVSPATAFSGLASNAVLSVIAVMVLGYGIDRSGIMNRVAWKIVEVAGTGEKRLTAISSAVVGIVSAFMQNIGSAALFLPALLRISRNTGTPPSRLLMPMGFAAILGGTITMVGSSPLILLNDLLRQSGLEPFGFFSVTPIGLCLLAAGILYFLVLGHSVLPAAESSGVVRHPQRELIETWQLPSYIHTYTILDDSTLIGRTREEIPLQNRYHLSLLAIAEKGDILYAPWRFTPFSAGQALILLGTADDARSFARDFGCAQKYEPQILPGDEDAAGFAELLVRPRAGITGKTFRDLTFRKKYGLEPLVLMKGDREERETMSDIPLTPGDTIVVYGSWTRIRAIGADPNFVLVTPVEGDGIRPSKATFAILCFSGGILLTLTGVPIALGLLSGALAMILLGVLSIDEAYRSIDWRTIFLLAGLIPLGAAMDSTGTAAFMADWLAVITGGSPAIIVLLAVALLTTFLTLFMSNVAATVLLVPLVILIGEGSGIDPRALALLVGICASNSFMLPTHQVNAFLMSPGGYHNYDYFRAGGLMSVVFIVVAVGLIYILYL